MVKIVPFDDGTYAVYRDQTLLVFGLTQPQADHLASVLRTQRL